MTDKPNPTKPRPPAPRERAPRRTPQNRDKPADQHDRIQPPPAPRDYEPPDPDDPQRSGT